MPAIKKILVPCAVLCAGVGLGGGVSFATAQALGLNEHSGANTVDDSDVETAFVKVDQLLAPLVREDGRLSGYVAFQFELEVPAEKAPLVEARLPMLLHGINMRTYRTPMASGPDGYLPELGSFRKIVAKASTDAFGKGVVRNIAVTEAIPG